MASLIYKIGVLALGTYLQLSEILGNEKSKRGNIGRKKWKQNLAGLDTKKKNFLDSCRFTWRSDYGHAINRRNI